MTVPSSVSRMSYIGADSTSVFPFSYKVFDQSELLVTVALTSTGVETTLVITTDYTVSGVGTSTGGNVTLVNASQAWLTAGNLKTGFTMTIRRVVAVTQTTSIISNGPYDAKLHEKAFDRSVMRDQQVVDEINRALQLPETEAGTAAKTTIPDAVTRASKALGFDASGNPTAMTVTSVGAPLTASYVTAVSQGDLSAERVLTGTANQIAVTDNGANSTVVVSSVTPETFCARLTLATAVPVTTADQIAKSTIYLTPYLGDQISLYNGSSAWVIFTLSEITIIVPASTNQMYDLFVYNNSGTPTLETLAWTNDTTRATALTTQNGVLVKTGVTTRRYIGSFRTTGVSGQTEDSEAKRYLWNYYHRVRRTMNAVDTTNTYVYSNATFRQARATTTNQLDMVIGVSEDLVSARVVGSAQTSSITGANPQPMVGIGIDSTTTPSSTIAQWVAFSAIDIPLSSSADYRGYPGIGRHTLVWLEAVRDTVGTQTWYGDVGITGVQSGIVGELFG